MAEIVMPRLSDTMEEGTILRWLKRDGEHVAPRRGARRDRDRQGDDDLRVRPGGRRLQTVAAEGDTLAVGAADRACRRGASGDDAPTARRRRRGARPRRRAGAPQRQPRRPAPRRRRRRPRARRRAAATAARVKASPLARRIARERGVDLHALTGSGPGGRIVKADVEGAAGAGRRAGAAGGRRRRRRTAPRAGASPRRSRRPRARRPSVELTRTQQTIARRMAESKATIPDFTLQIDVDMEECVRAARRAQARSPQPTERADLQRHGRQGLRARAARAPARERQLPRRRACSCTRASTSASPSPREDALVVPTVFDADAKSLGEIARETRALAERVRDGTITPPELGGGTFTVSNLGMYGDHAASPRSSTRRRRRSCRSARSSSAPSCATGELVARHTMTLTLACDHRILYGADAAAVPRAHPRAAGGAGGADAVTAQTHAATCRRSSCARCSDADADELHALIERNRARLAQWMHWAQDADARADTAPSSAGHDEKAARTWPQRAIVPTWASMAADARLRHRR